MRRALGPALLVLGSLAFCALALEAGLRLAGVPHREARFLCLDPIMGNVFCAGVEGAVPSPAGSQHVRINSEGMADREYPRRKPAGTVRIALLGDSVAASIYLPQEQKFEGLWEARLPARLARPVEVLNFAIDGTATWEQNQLFHLRARHFEPDLTLLAFYWGNDTWGNASARARKRPDPLADEYPAPSMLLKVKVAQRRLARWTWNHSRAYQFLRTLRDRLATQADYRRAQQDAASVAPARASSDPAYAWQSADWDLTRALILKLKAQASAAGSRLAVLHIPALDQVLADRLPYAEFRAFLAGQGIASLDFFDAIEPLDEKEKTALYIDDRFHLSARGHALLALSLEQALAALLGAGRPAPAAGRPG